jgi:hypothetical protein
MSGVTEVLAYWHGGSGRASLNTRSRRYHPDRPGPILRGGVRRL